MKNTVLIVENDAEQRRTLQRLLIASYKVIVVEKSRTIADEIAQYQPDLVILDHMDECTTIRTQWPTIAILFLSVETRVKTIVQALDAGADDYVVKPYGQYELEARIRALLRRVPEPGRSRQIQEPEHLQSEDGYLSLDKHNHQAFVGGNRVTFTPTEFAIIWKLLLHTGKVLTHRTLLQAVWGPEYASEVDYLRVYVRHIRQKIEVNPSKPCYIHTELGVGYVLRSPSSTKTQEATISQ